MFATVMEPAPGTPVISAVTAVLPDWSGHMEVSRLSERPVDDDVTLVELSKRLDAVDEEDDLLPKVPDKTSEPVESWAEPFKAAVVPNSHVPSRMSSWEGHPDPLERNIESIVI